MANPSPKKEAVTGTRLVWVYPSRASQMPPRTRVSCRCGASPPDVGSTSTIFPALFNPRG